MHRRWSAVECKTSNNRKQKRVKPQAQQPRRVEEQRQILNLGVQLLAAQTLERAAALRQRGVCGQLGETRPQKEKVLRWKTR